MDVKVREDANWRRNVDIFIPQDELRPKIENAYKKYQKRVKIQGFRKGKAPIHLIKKLYGDRIEVEAIDDILPEIVTQAWRQENLRIVSTPKVEKLDYKPGEDLNLTFSVEVEPEIELTKYEDFKLERKIYQVSEEDKERALESLREKHATWENVDGPIEEDLYVMADFQELDHTGFPIIGHKYENRLLAPRDESGEVSEIGQQLLGAKTGEERVIQLAAELQDAIGDPAKEPVKLRVIIKEVKRKVLPELDDEFAKDVGDYETLEDLKNAVEKQIEADMQSRLEDELHHNIIDELIKNNPFDVPESMVNNYLDMLIEQIKNSANDENVDENAVRDEYRAGAIWNIKWRLIRNKLIEMQKIEVTEDELRAAVEHYALARKADPMRLWNRVKNSEDELDRFRHDELEKKVLQFFLEKQKIKEKKVSLKDLERRRIVEV